MSGTTPVVLRPWTARPARRVRRAHARETGRFVKSRDGTRPTTRCDALDSPSNVDVVTDPVTATITNNELFIPTVSADRPYDLSVHTDMHVFPGLANYEQIGAHFNVPLVLAATVFTTGVGVIVASQLWERSFRKLVFPEEERNEKIENPESNTLCGIECSAFPIFQNEKVVRAVVFAERWHHGQYRRTGEPYVTHCVEAALILAAMLPVTKSSKNAKKKYVDAIVACILHDVVDDTECDIIDVKAVFGGTVATLVTDVSTLGKLPQILRRSQRRRLETVNESDLERDALKKASNPKPLKIAETKENFQGVDVAELASLRRMLWSLVSDPRCFLIKFADRIHNMRTVFVVDPVKAQFVANETLQVWCSFAEQLGMFGAKAEMEDLSFAVKDPASFRKVINARYDTWGAEAVEVKKKKMRKNATEESSVRSVEGYVEEPFEDSLPSSSRSVSEEASSTAITWTWEPPTGADVQMFFEKIRRGENAGTPRDLRLLRRSERAALAVKENLRLIAEAARAAVLEEERQRRAKPISLEQEELKALLQCVPPFDVLRASNRSVKSAAAAVAATKTADAATVVAIAGLGADADAQAYADAQMGGASLEASLEALRLCQNTTLRSLQLDALAPGLRVDIKGRLKSAYSTHLKMRRKGVGFNQVCDARALRVVVGEPGEQPGTREEVIACFDLVAAIHKLYRPVPNEYDDYISNPKESGYQSLHTAVIGPDGALLEFQVRTRAMHEAAEFGDAAHWLYKDFIADADKEVVQEEEALDEEIEEEVKVTVSETDSEMESDSQQVHVGQPVLIVRDVRGDRLTAGVVAWTEGSRMHVVEPKRGDAFAPGYANAAGVVDVVEWVAMDMHLCLLNQAVESGRVEPRQTGRGYSVIEFALCSDNRWHQRDAYGRVTGAAADPLDVDALIAALEKAKEVDEEVFQAADNVVSTNANNSNSSSVLSDEPSTLGKISLGSDSDTKVLADLASPDDEMVGIQVKAMQQALASYLDDVAEDDANDVVSGMGEPTTVLDTLEQGLTTFDDVTALRDFKETAAAAAWASLSVAERDLAKTLDDSKNSKSLQISTAEMVERARVELKVSLDKLARDATREKKKRRKAAELKLLRSGEKQTPEFNIARAAAQGEPGFVPSSDFENDQDEKNSSSELFDATDAVEMAVNLSSGSSGDYASLLSPTVTLDDENVLVVAWTNADGDASTPMKPELLKVPKGVTAAQLRTAECIGEDLETFISETAETTANQSSKKTPELVNVNMEMVPADTPLKQGDQVFLGDER